MSTEDELRSLVSDLVAALSLYVRLDNDRRAGCRITADDWAPCYQTAQCALAEAARVQPSCAWATSPAAHNEQGEAAQ